ncbi:unnamed protein product [Dibothriocephalus latus]|uniref:Uncharacterized protein n=1 Tax=Dibothriocephalus latus TaxID=60516 RepID=A0A3P7P6H2_DIBLA|nr:unnamed protein product [Dibothriocephalus latus]
MTSISPSDSLNVGPLSKFQQQLTSPQLHSSVYEFQEVEDNCNAKRRGYQKPKHRWMAKDHYMTVSSPGRKFPSESPLFRRELIGATEAQLASSRNLDHQSVPHTFGSLTPARNFYSACSPSTSSSAPGTVVMPSSLTNTSSSPSNHTPPHSRVESGVILNGTHCTSPTVESYASLAPPVSGDTTCPYKADFTTPPTLPADRVPQKLSKTRVRAAAPKSKTTKKRVKKEKVRVIPLTGPKLGLAGSAMNEKASVPSKNAIPSSSSLHVDTASVDKSLNPVIADPSLAPGFIAKVDWLACEQCSYLSCSKLFPFLEFYSKLYNPRTRVKGYTDAVKMAKSILNSTNDENAAVDRASRSSQDELSATPLQVPVAPPATVVNQSFDFAQHPHNQRLPCNGDSHEVPDFVNSNPLDLSLNFRLSSAHFNSKGSEPADNQLSPHLLNLSNNAAEPYQDAPLPDLGNNVWTPLPQLDIAGFGDIISHVPTFSEDEDDAESSNFAVQALNPVARGCSGPPGKREGTSGEPRKDK